MKKFTSYLSEIRFDPKLLHSIHAKYLANTRLVLLLIISIIIIGVSGFIAIPRRLNPEIKIPIVTIVTVLPGAGPQDIESLVTVPIEDKLTSVKGLDTISSTSQDNVSVITMQFLSNVEPEKARSNTQAKVDTVTLPTDAKTPTVSAIDFEDQPVWEFVVTSDTDQASLMRFAKTLQKKLEDDTKIDRVVVSGFTTQEVQVTIDPIKLSEYNINPLVLSQLISKATNAYPSGNVQTTQAAFSLTIDQQVTTIEDIRNLRLSYQDQTIKLSDVATIAEKPTINQPITYYATKTHNPTPTVQFFVYKTSGSNIDAVGKASEKIVDETLHQYNNRFEITTIINTAEEIDTQFSELVGEFQSTIILVFLNLFIFLGLRQAIIASLTIPLTMLSSIAILNMLGYSMNFLTMFAFLIALGLLIDDTIVTVAAMTRYYATGRFSPYQTGLLVWRDFIVPLWSTTITTIWAFVPLLLASGIIGEFIKPIPVVVTTTMLSSTTIAVLVTIPLMIFLLKPAFPRRVSILLKILCVLLLLVFGYLLFQQTILLPILFTIYIIFILVTFRVRKELMLSLRVLTVKSPKAYAIINKLKYYTNHGILNIEVLSRYYMAVIDRILSSKKALWQTLIAIIIFAFVSYLLVPLGLVTSEFFPKSDQDTLFVQVDLPSGTNLSIAQREGLDLMQKLRATKHLKFITLETGKGMSANGGSSPASNSLLYTLQLTPKKERNTSSVDIAQSLRQKYKIYAKGTLAVQEQSGGPPAGADLQIQLLGEDLGILHTYADKIVDHLKKEQGVTDPKKSVKLGTSKLTFVPDKEKFASHGVSADSVAIYLRSFTSGMQIKTVKMNNDNIDIVFHIDADRSPESLGTIQIPTQTGSVPLLSLGEIRLENNPTVINRESGKRTIGVSATVTKGFSPTEKNKDLEKFADSLNLPAGYSWKTGGVNEENEKSVQSILQAMLLSFLLILITMVLEFRSFRQALIVMLVIPLAVSGVFYVFALTGIPLSFPALIGILALFGIVVTTAIVLVEKINENRRHGMTLHDAIVDASGSRLEPILLTSISSILGLIPITLSNPLWQGLGGAIISGLFFAGIIKLFFIPVVYYLWYKNDEETIIVTKEQG